MIESVNLNLFHLINASEQSPAWLINAARILSEAPQFILATLVLLFLYQNREKAAFYLVTVTGTIVLALVISKLTGILLPIDRPFVAGHGFQWLDHSPDPSFPSDHATLLFAVAGAALWHRDSRFLCLVAVLLGCLNGWARITVGIHYPMDIMGACVVGFVSGAAVFTGAKVFFSLFDVSWSISRKN